MRTSLATMNVNMYVSVSAALNRSKYRTSYPKYKKCFLLLLLPFYPLGQIKVSTSLVQNELEKNKATEVESKPNITTLTYLRYITPAQEYGTKSFY